MPEDHDPFDDDLRPRTADPAAPAVDALRAMAARPAPEPTGALAAFLADPTAEEASPRPRRHPVTIVRISARKAGRVAVAGGAALAIAALGGAALAATHGPSGEHTAQVQQDEPSDTTTSSDETQTSGASETESTDETTTTSSDDESSSTGSDDAGAEQDGTATARTANPTAAANHADGQGADDEHADVNGGGVVDHRAERSPTAHPTRGEHPGGAPSSPAPAGVSTNPVEQPGGGASHPRH